MSLRPAGSCAASATSRGHSRRVSSGGQTGARLHRSGAVVEAEAAIARSSAVLARGEGGVIHYRNTYPDDPHLRLWSGLIARHAGDTQTAEAEFAAAATLGVVPRF